MYRNSSKKDFDYKWLYNMSVSIMGKIKSLSDDAGCEILIEVSKAVNYVIVFCEEIIEQIDILPNTNEADSVSLDEVCSGTPVDLNFISYESLFDISISALEKISKLTEDAVSDPGLEIHELSTDAGNAFNMFTNMLSDAASTEAYLGLAMQLLPLTKDCISAQAVIVDSGIN